MVFSVSDSLVLLIISGGVRWIMLLLVFLVSMLCLVSVKVKLCVLMLVLSCRLINKLCLCICCMLWLISVFSLLMNVVFMWVVCCGSCFFISKVSVVCLMCVVSGLLLNVELWLFGWNMLMIVLWFVMVDIGIMLFLSVLLSIIKLVLMFLC